MELETNPVGMVYGNGASHRATDVVREQAAALLGCTADELLLTRSTTEAMNSVATGIRWMSGDRVLTTDQEHDGGSLGWRHVARRHGVAIDRIEIATTDHDPGRIVDRLAAALTPKTRVVSVSHVITTTGLRMPIREIAALARSRGVLCVVDGAQALGHVPVDVRALGCDAYAACGHKWLLGPKGTGLLYISKDAEDRIQPVQREDGRRFVAHSTGIGSLPLIAGLGVAIEAAQARGAAAIERRILDLRARAYAGMQAIPKLTMAEPAVGIAGHRPRRRSCPGSVSVRRPARPAPRPASRDREDGREAVVQRHPPLAAHLQHRRRRGRRAGGDSRRAGAFGRRRLSTLTTARDGGRCRESRAARPGAAPRGRTRPLPPGERASDARRRARPMRVRSTLARIWLRTASASSSPCRMPTCAPSDDVWPLPCEATPPPAVVTRTSAMPK